MTRRRINGVPQRRKAKNLPTKPIRRGPGDGDRGGTVGCPPFLVAIMILVALFMWLVTT